MTAEMNAPGAPAGGGGQSPDRKRPSRKVIIIAAAAVLLLAGGAVVTSTNIARAEAEETARQCAVALKASAASHEAVQASIVRSEVQLDNVHVVDLPGTDGWQSTSYLERPAAEAVAAVPASDGVEAAEAIPARPSGMELVQNAMAAREDAATFEKAKGCKDRDDAAKITKAAKESGALVTALDERVAIVAEDFAAFQVDETERIAAEIEAARIKAEEEARLRAEEEARQRAAAEAAARDAAAQRAKQSSGSSGSSSPVRRPSGGGSTSQPPASSGGGGGSGGGSPSRPPSGGGGVGSGGGGCWTSNGAGGSMPC